MIWLSVIVAFLSGAAIEACCVGWVHYSERGKALQTAAFSALIGIADVTGMADAITKRGAYAIAFVIGYTIGTYVTVRIKGGHRYEART